MSEAFEIQYLEHQGMEKGLHVPPPQMESYVDDLSANQVSHHGMRRPRHSRLRQHSNLSPMSSGHALSSKRLAQSATSSAIDIEGESAVKPTVSVDIVSSGQVYRQLFDAGVQLRKRYDEGVSDRIQKNAPTIKNRFGGIPLVHMSRDMVKEGTGILGVRQQQWLSGFSNEDDVENPVLYKYEQEQRLGEMQETEADVHLKEVRDLPDDIVCKKTGSDIMQKINKSREEKHECALDEMHQELLMISDELEPKIERAGANLMDKLTEDEQELASLILEIEDSERLLSHTQPELKELWDRIQTKSSARRLWIKNTISMLNKIEDERSEKVTQVLSKYTDIVRSIAYIQSKPELDRVIDQESQLLNKTLLSNRRCYCELSLRLLTADIEREKKAHDLFNLKNSQWKKHKVAEAVESFRKFMSDSSVTDPNAISVIISNMAADQKSVHQKRLEILETLRDFKPPSATKKSVYSWNEQIEELSSLLNEVNQRYMQQVYSEYEKVCEMCAQKATEVRAALYKCGAVEASEADQLVNDTLIPMIGRQQKLYESTMEKIDKDIEKQCAAINKELSLLFKYCQGSAHVWDVHEIGLAQTERALQEKLMISRRDHDLENQHRESQLDIVMDKMRQDANEMNLAKNLKKVKESLDIIKEMYERFHRDQLEVVQTYPHMVREELEDFDLVIRTYFAVDRDKPSADSPTTESLAKPSLKPSVVDEESLADVQLSPSITPEADVSIDVTAADSLGADDSAVTESAAAGEDSAEKVAVQQLEALSAELDVDKGEAARNRYYLDGVTSHPLPGEVGEYLTTDRGTHYYVLCVESEDSQGDTTARDVYEDEGQGQTFLTEVNLAGIAKTSSQNYEFLESFFISPEYFIKLKQSIRLNFITYMENWTDEAIQRAHSIIAAKSDELNSELELRLHLHAPRARRAELDVHNVRAAELMMHNERVVRHCKGINQTLADLKLQFDKLLTEHQLTFDEFQKGVEAMEAVVLRGNKSSVLVEQQAAVQKAKEGFMNEIRVSLRTFRRSLDDTLQLMRESNAMFIKSFKLFSDGGNFCPEEIDVFRKNLDKYSHKVDDSEGGIMSELEGVEAKWLKRATQLAVDFEDRFRNHMIDLVFIERVARWLTNTQVKVKAEVAESNQQAKTLALHLNELEKRIDACEKPNLDKEVVSCSDLVASLKPIFTSFHKRADYIDCRITDSSETGETKTGTVTKPSKVGFADAAPPGLSSLTPSGPTALTGGGGKQKQAVEDPTVTIVKNIYKTQRPAERAASPSVKDKKSEQVSQSAAAEGADNKPTGSESRPLTEKSGKTRSNKQSRASQRRGSSVGESKNRHSSAARRITRFDRKDKRFQLFPDEPPVDSEYYEKEFDDLLGKIRRVIREAHEGLIAAAEVFYKQKGTHAITRPYALQPTMESCAETITHKLQSYFHQAVDYHNQCLQEFRHQLVRLETLTERIPPLVIKDNKRSSEAEYAAQRAQLQRAFMERMEQIDRTRFEHKTLLRPTLGHPNHAAKMAALCSDEGKRSELCVQEINDYEIALKRLGEEHAAMFIEKISASSAELLLLFDDMLTVDDVIKGKIIPNKYPTNELLRRNKHGEPLFDKIPETLIPRGAATWQGVSTDEMVVLKPPPTSNIKESKLKSSTASTKPKFTANIHTQKTTIGHNSTLESRDDAYKTYKMEFYQTISHIEKEKEERLLDESRWTDSWSNSIQKIRSLY